MNTETTKELFAKLQSMNATISNISEQRRKLQYEIDVRLAASMVGQCFKHRLNERPARYLYTKVISADKHFITTEKIVDESSHSFEYSVTSMHSPSYLLDRDNEFDSITLKEYEKIKKEQLKKMKDKCSG